MTLIKVKSRGTDNVAGRKNLIINGAMRVAQRGTSVSIPATTAYGACDRWKVYNSNAGAFDYKQSTDVPSGQGFGNSLQVDITTASASPATSHYSILSHRFEGQNLQQLKKGTANAEQFTISFWVKSSVTGTIAIEMYDADNTRSCSKTFTIDSANTWEFKTITYPADTTGAFDNDNGDSMGMNIWIMAGTDYTSGSVSGTWGSPTQANRASAYNIYSNTSNNLYITGFQLEVGNSASDFEHLSFGEELALCHRYFYNGLTSNGSGTYSIFPVNFRNHVSTGNNGHIAFTVALPQPMRTIPTLTHDLANSNHAGNGVATGATTWNFYHQNQGWGSYAGNGNLNTLSRSGSTDSQVQLGTYYISPNSITYDQLTIGSSRKMHFSSEL